MVCGILLTHEIFSFKITFNIIFIVIVFTDCAGESLRHREKVVPDSALAAVASALKSNLCKRLGKEQLGLSEGDIRAIEQSNFEHGSEVSKAILQNWKLRNGTAASFVALTSALQKFDPTLETVQGAVAVLQDAGKSTTLHHFSTFTN